MTLQKVIKKYNKFKVNVTKLKTLREEKEDILLTKTKECKVIEDDVDSLIKVRHLLESCNLASRDFIKGEVETLVSQALQSIFSIPNIQFKIEFVSKRNQTEAIFFLTSKEQDKDKDKDSIKFSNELTFAHGGGVVDIISISLRLIIMQLLKLEGPLMLDEPGKNISAQYIVNFGKFLTYISTAFNRQIIMVTHNDTLINCASNTIRVEKKGKEAYING